MRFESRSKKKRTYRIARRNSGVCSDSSVFLFRLTLNEFLQYRGEGVPCDDFVFARLAYNIH